MEIDNFGTWLEIDLSILEKNYQILSGIFNKPIMPIVKANGYGHGLRKVAERFEKAGAEWIGVARIEEALLLREYGIKSKILVLGYTSPKRIPHAIKEKITLSVYDFEVAMQYAIQARSLTEAVELHAKIDTGMGRLGIQPSKAVEFVKLLNEEPSIKLEGLFSHFARADEPEVDDTSKQIAKFNILLNEIDSKTQLPPLVHAANSAGAILFPESRYSFVRVGIALYGLPPSSSVCLPEGVRPALAWKARLISKKKLPAGHGVSYGFKYYTKKNEMIGVVAVGYGDGLRRIDGNSVLIHGKLVKIIGNVCMDQIMVQLDDIPEAEIGDEVVLIGNQQGQEITATDIARNWHTINYEVICGLASRMPRIYRQ
jgi:alanine racemase